MSVESEELCLRCQEWTLAACRCLSDKLLSFLKRVQGGERSLAFGGFFAFAFASRQLLSSVKNSAFEDAIVVRSGNGGRFVLGCIGRARLQHFLQFTLRIIDVGDAHEMSERILETFENEIARSLEPPIEEDRPEQGLEGIRQRGLLLAATAGFFAAT